MIETTTDLKWVAGERARARTRRTLWAVFVGLGLLTARPSLLAGPGNPLTIKFVARTPEQVSAFYTARGFPPAMVELLARQCFITVSVHNTGDRVVWLELASWRFSSDGKQVTRYHRDHWKPLWKDMSVPLASQSTFRWTLLPETLDFQPDEKEGGNIVLPRIKGDITLDAEFASGRDKRGPLIRLRYENLRCGEDQP